MLSLDFLNCWKCLSIVFSFKNFAIKPLLGISFHSFSLLRGDFANNCHNFLKEIWICCIDVDENFVVWKTQLSKALFIIINPIVFQWMEVNVLVNIVCFKFKNFSCTKISWWSDKSTLRTLFWENLGRKLPKIKSIKVEVTRFGHWISCFKVCIAQNWW